MTARLYIDKQLACIAEARLNVVMDELWVRNGAHSIGLYSTYTQTEKNIYFRDNRIAGNKSAVSYCT